MKLNSILLSLIFIFAYNQAKAWREVNNGGGITEQNITYVTQNFTYLITPLLNSNSFNLTAPEKNELIILANKIQNTVSIRFQNQLSIDERPYFILNNEWWIQTPYLDSYDLNLNDELSWPEVISLILDISSKSDKSGLKKILIDYFNSQIEQQIFTLNKDHNMQTTSILTNNKSQVDFLLQIDDSNPLSLASYIQTFSNCTKDALNNFKYKLPNIKLTTSSENTVITVIGLKFDFTCNKIKKQNDLLLKLKKTGSTLELIDWGIL